MNKLIRDGMVAVLYSPGFGAGWTTWGLPQEAMFHPELVEATLAGDYDRMQAIAKEQWPRHYVGGLDGLEVKWLPVGSRFRISEYDGYETVEVEMEGYWLTA
jgi:hypothetical protein